MNEMQRKGIITETECQLFFLKKGYMVYLPVSPDSRCDMIVDINKKLIKIQVKTSRLTEKETGIEFNAYSISGGKKIEYLKEDIDFFATSYNGEVYLIPIEICGKNQKILSFKNSSYSNVTLLEDYEAERVIQDILNEKDFSTIKISPLKKSVAQFEKDGRYVKTYSSLSEAAKAINKEEGLSHISQAANQKRASAYGYIWRFV